MTEPTEGDAPTRRGRPRPESTIARDEQVFELIPADGSTITRNALADALQVEPKAIYLSLYRLSRSQRIERVHEGGSHVWKRVSAGVE